MFVQMTGVAGSEQDTVKNFCRVHRAFVPTENRYGAVATIFALFVRKVALHVVVMHPSSVNGEHLFPTCSSRVFRVTHSSDDIEVRFYIILPCLRFLYSLFCDP